MAPHVIEQKPHPLIISYQLNFLEAREADAKKLSSQTLTIAEMKSIFHDWASYSEPYGFGYLVNLAEDALDSLDKYSRLPIDFQATLSKYLQDKRNAL